MQERDKENLKSVEAAKDLEGKSFSEVAEFFRAMLEEAFVLTEKCRDIYNKKLPFSEPGILRIKFEFPSTLAIQVIYSFNKFDSLKLGTVETIVVSGSPTATVRKIGEVRSKLVVGADALFVIAQVLANSDARKFLLEEFRKLKKRIEDTLNNFESLASTLIKVCQMAKAAKEMEE